MQKIMRSEQQIKTMKLLFFCLFAFQEFIQGGEITRLLPCRLSLVVLPDKDTFLGSSRNIAAYLHNCPNIYDGKGRLQCYYRSRHGALESIPLIIPSSSTIRHSYKDSVMIITGLVLTDNFDYLQRTPGLPLDKNDTRCCQYKGIDGESNWGCLSNNEHWMEDMQSTLGPLRLSQIVIPGSHHSGANYGTMKVDCQDTTVMQQLLSGIRFLDLRPKVIEDLSPGNYDGFQFVHYHWRINRTPLKTIFEQVAAFVAKYKKEVIFIDLHEFHPSLPHRLCATLNRLVTDTIGKYQYKRVAGVNFADINLNDIMESDERVIIGSAKCGITCKFFASAYRAYDSTIEVGVLNSFLKAFSYKHRESRDLIVDMAHLTTSYLSVIHTSPKELAHQNNFLISTFYRYNWEIWGTANAIAMDYVMGSDIVELSIYLNERRHGVLKELNPIRKACYLSIGASGGLYGSNGELSQDRAVVIFITTKNETIRSQAEVKLYLSKAEKTPRTTIPMNGSEYETVVTENTIRIFTDYVNLKPNFRDNPAPTKLDYGHVFTIELNNQVLNEASFKLNPNWMERLLPLIGNIPSFLLTIPTTHHSGSYFTDAPTGPFEKEFNMSQLRQGESILEQLIYGIRGLDLHVQPYMSESTLNRSGEYKQFITDGGNIVNNLESVLQDVTTFLDNHLYEVIFIEIMFHSGSVENKAMAHNSLERVVKKTLGKHLCLQPGAHENLNYYVKTLNQRAVVSVNTRRHSFSWSMAPAERINFVKDKRKPLAEVEVIEQERLHLSAEKRRMTVLVEPDNDNIGPRNVAYFNNLPLMTWIKNRPPELPNMIAVDHFLSTDLIDTCIIFNLRKAEYR